MGCRRWFRVSCLLPLLGPCLTAAPAEELVRLDSSGVVRWSADGREVALFGANYCLPSSSDYRAAGYVGADRKQLIEQDMAHFARMGWDGLRLAIWGDWENCDREGNLIVNDHLDLLDYLILQAKQRGISMLFTPIHRHSALWPDGQDSDAIQGFSKFYPVAELGTHPDAIAAQQNYLRQILEHVNPYTGVALKDEPAIVFIELINEPHHHAEDIPGSIRYINALAEAVRSTGCQKLLFHNLSQDFRILPAITSSAAQGFSFGWYPTALGARRTLTENYLRWVDEYTPLRGELPAMPRIVYEFDSADMLSGTMYPAMVRAYREVGAQFAAMFAYDMLATAPYNLGWQTHYLNLIHSPTKAVSAIIAAEAMRTLPRGQTYGPYPQNTRFGPFRVSYADDLSEMITAEQFFHANDTHSAPPDPAALRQVVGVGRSPVVEYEGLGCYFLEKIDAGRWRLELYPDALFVQDPFAQRLNYRTRSSRLVSREWPMRIDLPDLGSVFSVQPLNEGNVHSAATTDGTFAIRPGVYLLVRDGIAASRDLPTHVGRVGLREFVCPAPIDLPIQAVLHLRSEYLLGSDAIVGADVIDEQPLRRVALRMTAGGRSQDFPMVRQRGHLHEAQIPATALNAGAVEFSVIVESAGGELVLPDAPSDTWRSRFVKSTSPISLLDAVRDGSRVFTLRLQGESEGYLQSIPATDSRPAVLRLRSPAPTSMQRHTFSLPVKTVVRDRGPAIEAATAVRFVAQGRGSLVLTLVEEDGTAWSASLALDLTEPGSRQVPLSEFRSSTATKLPLGYPGNWNRELRPPAGRGGPDDRLRLPQVEHLQITALPADSPSSRELLLDITRVELIFEK